MIIRKRKCDNRSRNQNQRQVGAKSIATNHTNLKSKDRVCRKGVKN